MPNEQSFSQNLQTQQPLISFIIPAWNLPEGLLNQCVKSIMDLDLGPDEREVIVVDDGSGHPAFQELAPWKKEVHLLCQPHAGLSVARNKGLALATGQYVQFVDGDDLLLKAPYNHCIQLLKRGDIDVLMFESVTAETQQDEFTDAEAVTGVEYLLHHNLHGSACGYIFSYSLLGQLRFTPGILHEDEEFTPLLLLGAEHLVTTSAQCYFYRQRPASIMHTTDQAATDKGLNDAEGVVMRLNHKACTLPLHLRQALSRRVAQLTMDLMFNTMVQTHSWHRLQALTHRLQAVGLFPLPLKNYTRKYLLFAQLTRWAPGRLLALALLSTDFHKND